MNPKKRNSNPKDKDFDFETLDQNQFNKELKKRKIRRWKIKLTKVKVKIISLSIKVISLPAKKVLKLIFLIKKIVRIVFKFVFSIEGFTIILLVRNTTFMSYQLYKMNQLIHAQQLQIVELQAKLEVIQPKADQPQEWYKNPKNLIATGLTTSILYQKVSSWMQKFSLEGQLAKYQIEIKNYQVKVSEMQTEISDLQKVVADAKINLNRWQDEMELKIEGIEKAGSSVFKNPDRNGFSGAKTFGSFSLNSGKNVLDLSSIDLSSKEIDTQLFKSIEGETSVNNLEMKIISANKTQSPSKLSGLQKTRKRAVTIYNKIRQKSKPITQHFTENPVVKSIAKNVELKIELDFPKGSPAPIKNPQPEKEEQKPVPEEEKTFLEQKKEKQEEKTELSWVKNWMKKIKERIQKKSKNK
jgi:hypothetical protein